MDSASDSGRESPTTSSPIDVSDDTAHPTAASDTPPVTSQPVVTSAASSVGHESTCPGVITTSSSSNVNSARSNVANNVSKISQTGCKSGRRDATGINLFGENRTGLGTSTHQYDRKGKKSPPTPRLFFPSSYW